MPLDQNDLRQIKDVVVEAVDPYFTAIQKDFEQVYGRFDKIEQLILVDHKKRIEKLEEEVKNLKELFSVR